tara:strand:- start:1913 stop:2308 length:396 start_codon:yes stop_codon:yes gene_type:complete
MAISLEKINLGDDLVICRNELGHWQLEGAAFSFPLTDSSDFKRVISLLETPIDNARLELGSDFPYICVMEVGLRHDSDYWIGLALSWIAGASIQEAYKLIEDLNTLSVDKAVSQKNRHLAKKELKRLLGED